MSDQRGLVSDILNELGDEQIFRVSATLEEHPEFADQYDILSQLVFEEYCSRVEHGEPADTVLFDLAVRYPKVKEQLEFLVDLDSEIASLLTATDEHDVAWPTIGEIVNGIKIRELIGKGHRSQVYLGVDRKVGGREVVLKVTPESKRELDFVGRLDHEHIVRILTMHEVADRSLHFIVMPFESTLTLHDTIVPNAQFLKVLSGTKWEKAATEWLSKSSFPNQQSSGGWCNWLGGQRGALEVCRLGIQLASALSYAHDEGILHCDIKPSNVLLLPNLDIKLLDFSLSNSINPSELDLRKCGGTPPYMAPEYQSCLVNRSKFDHRADIFSLGATLFHCLTGDFPYSEVGTNSPRSGLLSNVGFQRLQSRPGRILSEVRVESGLRTVLEKCLRLEPEERYNSAKDLADAFRSVLQRITQRQKRFRRRAIVSALAFSGGLTAFFAWPQSSQSKVVSHAENGNYDRAIAVCSSEIAKNNSENLFWLACRAYCYQKQEQHALAMNDLVAIFRRNGRGEAYCSAAYSAGVSRLTPAFVEELYQKGQKAGFENAACFNNQAVAHLRAADFKKAQFYILKAKKALGHSKTVRFNEAEIDFRIAVRNQRRPDLGLIESALEKTEQSNEQSTFYRDAALIYAFDYKLSSDQTSLKRCLELIETAVDRGASYQQIKVFERELIGASQNKRFQRILSRAVGSRIDRTVRRIDPILERKNLRAWLRAILGVDITNDAGFKNE